MFSIFSLLVERMAHSENWNNDKSIKCMTKTPDHHIKCLDITYTGRADCQHCALHKKDILAKIDVIKNQNILKRIAQFDYAKKSVVYVENCPAEFMYVVRRGLVKLEETLDDGSTRIVRVVRKGSIAGLETFLDNGQRYDQTAITLQDSELCRIPYDVVSTLLKNEPEFLESVLNEWHQHIAASNKVIVEFSTGALRHRLARVLLMLVKEANHNQLVEIEMLHIDDLAALTGVARESVSRIISEFKRDGLLIKSGVGKMRFDEAALREITGNGMEKVK